MQLSEYNFLLFEYFPPSLPIVLPMVSMELLSHEQRGVWDPRMTGPDEPDISKVMALDP